jgi:hypothetical protein
MSKEIKLKKRSLKERLEYIDKNKHKWTPLMYRCAMEQLRNDWIDKKIREENWFLGLYIWIREKII